MDTEMTCFGSSGGGIILNMTRRRTRAEIEVDIRLGSKVCTKCQERKPFSYFYERPEFADGVNSHCKKCQRVASEASRVKSREKYNAKTVEWQRANPDRVKAYRKARRFKRYGLTEESYAALLAAQGGVCKICRSPDPKHAHDSFVVDHDHSCCEPSKSTTCGKCVRGIICAPCNIIMGFARDCPNRLNDIAEYLRGWSRS